MNHNREPGQAVVSVEQVVDFLRRNPDFLLHQEDLLCEMELRHDSGPAVSLLERQVSLLRERNVQMRRRLATMVEIARENDTLLEKTQRLVISILEADTLDAVIEAVNRSLREDFKADVSALTLIGNAAPLDCNARVVSLQEARGVIGTLLGNGHAVCGALKRQELEFLFPDHYREVGSAAVAPLVNGGPLGVLAIGSHDPEYYKSSMGTVFLTYVSEVLNRVLPRHFPGNSS